MTTLPKGIQELRNDYLHLIVDQEAKLLYSEWIRKPSRAEYREATAILAKENIMYWIMDSSKLKGVPMNDQEWAIRQVSAIAALSPLKKVAWVTTDDQNMELFLKVVREAQAGLNASIQIQQFPSYREAAYWIENQY